MSEKLDPEEVKEIMTRVFDRIKGVIAKYDGFIEKFAGDAVMAIFGVPKAHEDDPVRAIRAAREIHDLVKFISPEVEGKTGTPLVMHSGINTGLVVTGEVNPDKGTHGVANLIRDNKTFQIGSLMQIGQTLGMRTFDDALMDLVRKSKITAETAYLRATNKDAFVPLVSPRFLEEVLA